MGFLQESDNFQDSGTLRRIPSPTLFNHFPQLVEQILVSGAQGSLIRGHHSKCRGCIRPVVKRHSTGENLSAI